MKQFYRNFKKQQIVGFFNICSLSLGIMVSLTVGLWAINELTYDSFYPEGDQVYRVVQTFELSGKRTKAATSFKPLGEIIQNELPSIEAMCRVVKEDEGITIHNQVTFGVTCLMVDSSFFSFFPFPIKEGISNNVFSAPDNVVITESAAARYFPGEDPIGQLIISHGYSFYISAVMHDFPRNSHIQGEMLFPFFGSFKNSQWNSGFYYDTYLRIRKGTDIKSVEKRLTEINKIGVVCFLGDAYNQVELEPLKDIHFSKSDNGFDHAVKGDKRFLLILIFTAFVILVIACINFTNLFISTAFIRAKTIGIKKSQGAAKSTLILEFYQETAIYVLISVGGGFLLTLLALPLFNEYTGSITVIDFSNPQLYFFLGILIVVTILMAGTFPAFRMTQFGIIDTLNGKFKGKRISFLQKMLVIIQFTSSITLLIIVFFFSRQIDTLLMQNLGFNNKNVFYVEGWKSFGVDFKSLREELTRNPAIADVAIKQYNLPLQIGNGAGIRNLKDGKTILVDLSEVTPNYFDFFEMKFIAGDNPLEMESSNEFRYCVINESMAHALGFENPVDATFSYVSIGGKLLENDGKTYTVKGVIQDSYVKSLHQHPGPQMYLSLSREDHNPIFFRVAGNTHEAIKAVEKKWKEVNANVPFEYRFLDEVYHEQYKNEINTRAVLRYAMLITFLISIAGLFAMAFYSTQRRVKEIAIRKINGARLIDLLILLNKDVVIWVIVSFLIACPITFFFLDNWLDNFIIRTSLSLWVFLSAGILSICVALLTVSLQTLKTATSNPVNSLKSE
ncbi:MAG: ABC transporter permease [Massilibacteroides sp.]|nr:ABC transporter permease [Massilibacteroides sp.]